MKKTQLQELRKLGRPAVLAKIKELKQSILDLKLKASRGEVKNVRESRNLRRDIARLMEEKS